MAAIMVVGEVLYDLFGQMGKNLVETVHFTPKMGGAPANLTVSAAKLGADVGFIGKVGQDELGDYIKDFMASQGIDIRYLTQSAHQPTMIALVGLPTPDKPQFILMPGATADLRPDDIPSAAIENAQMLVFGGVNLAWDCATATFAAAQIARAAGKMVVFDVNWRPSIWPNHETARTRLLAGIATADIVKLNVEEGEFLFGYHDPARIAQALMTYGVKLACISQGQAGAYLLIKEMSVHHPGFPIKAVDATGAGDAFLAGICVALIEHCHRIEEMTAADLAEIAAFANGCGAYVASHLGAMEAVFNRADILKFIESACETR